MRTWRLACRVGSAAAAAKDGRQFYCERRESLHLHGLRRSPPAYVPVPTDLDALVALLADERPSRFADFSGPRAVGDNAWRALAVLAQGRPAHAGGRFDRSTVDESRAPDRGEGGAGWWAGPSGGVTLRNSYFTAIFQIAHCPRDWSGSR